MATKVIQWTGSNWDDVERFIGVPLEHVKGWKHFTPKGAAEPVRFLHGWWVINRDSVFSAEQARPRGL